MQTPTDFQSRDDAGANEEFVPIEVADRPTAERDYGAEFEDNAMEARHG
jgi:hypothetical protein